MREDRYKTLRKQEELLNAYLIENNEEVTNRTRFTNAIKNDENDDLSPLKLLGSGFMFKNVTHAHFLKQFFVIMVLAIMMMVVYSKDSAYYTDGFFNAEFTVIGTPY